jgi:hypothetical protein
MGLDATLEDEFGEELDAFTDDEGRLAAAWPSGNPAYPILRHVDAEGTTLLNRNQLAAALPEFEAFALVAPAEVKPLAARLLKFARKGASEPHLYLRFLGD